jgi:hypothetical protein
MNLRGFSVLLLLLGAHLSFAQVSTPHPRLILDAATLTTLRARAAANTPQWQQLKTYCDSFIGGSVNLPSVGSDPYNSGNDYPDPPDIGQGYQGDAYWSALLAEGLCYQTLKSSDPSTAAQYGDKVVEILLAMATSCTTSPNECEPPCTDDGYGTRFYGVGFGIGYDWVYDRLTAPQKTAIYTTANTWLASFVDPLGCSYFEYVVPDGNYFAGYFHAITAVALATYEDNPQGPTLWSNWQNQEFNTAASNPPHIGVQPYFAAHMTGGGWPEGFGNYGPLATENMNVPAWEVRTATGTDLVHAANAYTFPVDAADYLMHFTWPSRDYVDDRDKNHATGNVVPPPGTANVGMFMQVLGTLRYWNAPHGDVFQAYTNIVNVAASGYGAGYAWETFLFWDPNGAAAAIDSLPLSYFASGMNAVAARSDWSTSASWMSFRAAPYVEVSGGGEEGFDQGSLAMVRGNTPLLVNAAGQIVHEPFGAEDENRIDTDAFGNTDGTIYSGNRTIYNIYYVRNITAGFVNDRYGQAAYTLEDDNAQTHVAAFEDGASYVLALAVRLEDMYRPDGSNNPQVASWSREIVYLRPNRVLVYDRTLAGNASGGNTADDQFLAFHFAANPVSASAPAGETRYDVTYNATYAGAMTTVYPANNTTAIVGLFPPNGSDAGSSQVKVWQVQVRPPDTSDTQRWLTVFDTATSAGAVATASRISVTQGGIVGSVLATASGNQAVLFNTGAPDTTIAGTLAYSTPAAATVHFITELPASTSYSVAAVVNGSNHDITVTPGGPLATSAHGVLTFTVSATGQVGFGDRIFADGFGP